MNNIKLIRLISNEEIIAQVLNEEDSDFITLHNPLAVIMTQDGKLSLVEWMPYIEKNDGIDVSAEKILFISTPASQLIEGYNKIFQKVVDVVGPKLLI